jgi:hypothetical protein
MRRGREPGRAGTGFRAGPRRPDGGVRPGAHLCRVFRPGPRSELGIGARAKPALLPGARAWPDAGFAPDPRSGPGAGPSAGAWIGVASPAGAAGAVIKRRGERGGERSGRRGPGGRRAPAAGDGFRAPAASGTRISPGTGIGMGPEAAARVVAHVCACGAEGADPVAVRVRAAAAARDGPAGHSQVQARLVGGTAALARPRIPVGVPARVSATSRPRVVADARVAVPARVTAPTQARGRARVMSAARVTVPARVGGATVQPTITGQARVTAVQAVRTARFNRTAFYRMLPPRMLVSGPPAYRAVPTVRTPVPAAITAVIAIGALAGVMSESTIRVEVGVTGGDGPTPARVPRGLRTTVAHAPSHPLGPPPLPSRNHSIMEHQRRTRYLVGEAGPTALPSVSRPVPRAPATATGRPQRFPEHEPRWEGGSARARASAPQALASPGPSLARRVCGRLRQRPHSFVAAGAIDTLVGAMDILVGAIDHKRRGQAGRW